jgi:hypothetical protein
MTMSRDRRELEAGKPVTLNAARRYLDLLHFDLYFGVLRASAGYGRLLAQQMHAKTTRIAA